MIAIPVFATPPDLLNACLRSIAEARRDADQAYVVVDGPQSPELEQVIDRASGQGFEVVRQPWRIGLVANWNACLQLGSCTLVHVMHADDAIAPGFYDAVRIAMSNDRVAVVAAGQSPGSHPAVRVSGGPAWSPPRAVLHGADAANYLLSRLKPATGSFVLRRSTIETAQGGFDPRFHYCPDEELFLRIIASGDLALVDPDLYAESNHDRQARRTAWHRPDCADVYYAARIEGAHAFGPSVVRSARRQTSRGLFSVGRFLCRAGDRQAALAIVRSIAAHDKGSLMYWKFWALLVLAVFAGDHGAPPPADITAPTTESRSHT